MTMTAPAIVPTAEEASPYETKPTRRHFASRRDQPRLSPDQAARQGRVVAAALRTFPSSAAAMAFLNTDHVELGRRPLDLAVESIAGLTAVEDVLALRAPASR
jgi:uncharacterized protein (DUF2384 family)